MLHHVNWKHYKKSQKSILLIEVFCFCYLHFYRPIVRSTISRWPTMFYVILISVTVVVTVTAQRKLVLFTLLIIFHESFLFDFVTTLWRINEWRSLRKDSLFDCRRLVAQTFNWNVVIYDHDDYFRRNYEGMTWLWKFNPILVFKLMNLV